MEILDHWSTVTIFKYNDALVNDEVKREKFFGYIREKGGSINELNSFARYFMKRFGLIKGMRIFTMIYTIPYFTAILVSIYLDVLPIEFGFILLSLMIGALYVQILKARTIRKRCKLLGVEL